MSNRKHQKQALLNNTFRFVRKFKNVLLELVIVFVGVYSAFYLNTYNQEKQEQENRQKILGALSEEVRNLGKTFEGISTYQTEFNMLAEQKYAQGLNLPELERLRYAAPQYSLEVLENALRSNTFEMLDLALHIKLARYYSDIQKLIDAEKKITEVSQGYVFLPEENTTARRKQYSWSILYLNDRKSLLITLSKSSAILVQELNMRKKDSD